MSLLTKLLSRKFLVTIATIAALFNAGETDSLRVGLVGLVAAVYVLAEAILDGRGQPSIVSKLADAVTDGIDLARTAGQGAPVVDVKAPSSEGFVPPSELPRIEQAAQATQTAGSS